MLTTSALDVENGQQNNGRTTNETEGLGPMPEEYLVARRLTGVQLLMFVFADGRIPSIAAHTVFMRAGSYDASRQRSKCQARVGGETFLGIGLDGGGVDVNQNHGTHPSGSIYDLQAAGNGSRVSTNPHYYPTRS
ncbi:hypothetical protein PG994_010156 [Apiospora phragmitis]|uniref:Uncharacterized protein n=1 Tax=Apiospora phragmitis TaxID=2905665 RepID=A0ABR1TRB6_9PEZI